MDKLCRTQIYLETEQIERLKSVSYKGRLSVSELIRQAIDRFLERPSGKQKGRQDALASAVGKINFKSNNLSKEHDRHLYGA